MRYLENKHPLGFAKSRPLRRAAAVLISFTVAAAFFLGTVGLENVDEYLFPTVNYPPRMPSCASLNMTGRRDIWEKAQDKFLQLLEDEFTIVMQTYQRPKELNTTLETLLGEVIPSLSEVVVVWNDMEAAPPPNFVSRHGVPVRFRMSRRNSLNEKLWADPDYRTQAVLLSDDDVFYRPQDLEFVFQSWRKFGRDRLTGALARCSSADSRGNLEYNFCSSRRGSDVYQMVLTNLCFAHLSYLEYYSSEEDATMAAVRDYVDGGFNCEDIALNYVQALLTGHGPLLVMGRDGYVNLDPSEGISNRRGHMEARSRCLNDFADMFGCMPLVDETAHIQRGVVVM